MHDGVVREPPRHRMVVRLDRPGRRRGDAPRTARRLPPNFETPEQLIAQAKPRLQLSFQDTTAASFGPVPFSGPGVRSAMAGTAGPLRQAPARGRRAYRACARDARKRARGRGEHDHHLHIRPRRVRGLTRTPRQGGIGLRGGHQGAADGQGPRGILTRSPERLRTQLTSSVDVAPLLLTIATGSQQWRSDHHYAQIAGRHDLASILADPDAPGRQYILHATDEIVTEFAIQPYAADARCTWSRCGRGAAKYVTYSHWAAGRGHAAAGRRGSGAV